MPNEYDKFRATMQFAGWTEDRIEAAWQAHIGLDRDGLPEQDDDYRYPDPEDWPGGRKLWQREMEADLCGPEDLLSEDDDLYCPHCGCSPCRDPDGYEEMPPMEYDEIDPDGPRGRKLIQCDVGDYVRLKGMADWCVVTRLDTFPPTGEPGCSLSRLQDGMVIFEDGGITVKNKPFVCGYSHKLVPMAEVEDRLPQVVEFKFKKGDLVVLDTSIYPRARSQYRLIERRLMKFAYSDELRPCWMVERGGGWCPTVYVSEASMSPYDPADERIKARVARLDRWHKNGLYIPQPRHQYKLLTWACSQDFETRRRADKAYFKMWLKCYRSMDAKVDRINTYAEMTPGASTENNLMGAFLRKRWYFQMHVKAMQDEAKRMDYETFRRKWFGMLEHADYRKDPFAC